VAEKNNVVKFHKKVQFNIGLVLLGIIVIYMAFHLFSFLTSEQITVYEVSAGTLVSNETYQAVAVRQEEVINAAASGSIYYYAGNMDQVGVKTNIYSIDTSGTVTDLLTAGSQEVSTLSGADQDKLETEISNFIYDYNNDNFQKVYSFQTDLSSALSQYYSNSIMSSMSAEILAAQQQGDFTLYTASAPGLVVYQLDGYEGLTVDDVSSETFSLGQPDITYLNTQTTVTQGQPVYKLITSDHWNLILQISQDLAESLQQEETSYINIRFVSDDAETWVACSITEMAGIYYLNLSLDDGVNRYADSRFLQIELLLNEESGLKIPNSAIVTKEFFTIPKAFAFWGSDSTDPGFMVRSDSGDTLISPEIFYESEDYYYIDDDELSDGDLLLKSDSGETYLVGQDRDSLPGVFCVNKGYAVFKRIELLYQNEDYTIIKNGTSYGVSLYDHIALQGSQIRENDVIY
jgi:hypothetical protein